jgi:hypothetical protein
MSTPEAEFRADHKVLERALTHHLKQRIHGAALEMRLFQFFGQNRLDLVRCMHSRCACAGFAQLLPQLNELVYDWLRNRVLDTRSTAVICELSSDAGLKRGEKTLEDILLCFLCSSWLAGLSPYLQCTAADVRCTY